MEHRPSAGRLKNLNRRSDRLRIKSYDYNYRRCEGLSTKFFGKVKAGQV